MSPGAGRVADVAIVGAGPAGAWAANELAQGGARVTIFDATHPREKPCGGGVSARALDLTGTAIGSIARTSVRTARFKDSRSRGDVVVPLAGHALLVASRRDFDASLLTAATRAGARHLPDRVTDVDVRASGVRLRTSCGEHRADVIVGADGANSLVRRRLSAGFRRDQLSIATGFFADGLTSDEIVIELVADPPGYIWSFPRPDHLAIGVCAQADAGVGVEELRVRAAQWIRETAVARDAPLRPYSWPIPSLAAGDFRSLTPAGPRWCLVGDAAGLVDPITREGIYWAIASGAWAARAILAGDLPSGYVDQVQSDAVSELARAARFKSRFFRPAFSGLLLGALRHSERIRAVMADLVAGRQSYRSLKWRLARTLEIALAWEALCAR
jgi:geranylgeranyl reductase family protein